MQVKPAIWNVVINGAWNPAILSPQGIGKYVLGIQEEKALEVHVRIDGIGAHAPFRVKHDSLLISTSPGKLLIDAEKPDCDTLDRAMSCGRTALTKLEATPVSAAGINFRFAASEPTTRAIAPLACPFDGDVARMGFKIVKKQIERTLEYDGGFLNVSVTDETSSEWLLVFNYHLKSERHEDLCQWLQKRSDDLLANAAKILKNVFDAELPEENRADE